MTTRSDRPALDQQRAFARELSPFWAKEARPGGLADLTKEHLRSNPPLAFVPETSRNRLSHCFATSGTTGPPTYSFWTQADWDFKIETVAEALRANFLLPERIVALNCYTLNHLAGSIFDGVVRSLGGVSIGAGYFEKSSRELAELFRSLGCNTLIVGDSESSYKYSVGARPALQEFGARAHAVELWLSSGPVSCEARAAAATCGVRASASFYGCSEMGFLAIGCPRHPNHYHRLGGDTLLEARADGQALVSRVGRSSAENPHVYLPHRGSQLIGYLNGDEVVLEAGSCGCGNSAERITSIRRVPESRLLPPSG